MYMYVHTCMYINIIQVLTTQLIEYIKICAKIYFSLHFECRNANTTQSAVCQNITTPLCFSNSHTTIPLYCTLPPEVSQIQLLPNFPNFLNKGQTLSLLLEVIITMYIINYCSTLTCIVSDFSQFLKLKTNLLISYKTILK